MRVHFTKWADCEPELRRALRHLPVRLSFGESLVPGDLVDLVVPLSVPALREAAQIPELVARNPLPLPSPLAIELCDDKLGLVRFLRACGLGAYVPVDPLPGSYPYVLKPRRGANGVNVSLIRGPEDERQKGDQLASADFFAQACVVGDEEFAAHILFMDGKIRHQVEVGYRMPSAVAMRGPEHFRQKQRCRPHFAVEWAEVLRAVGFEGICCINYKVQGGRPIVLEINPRMGFSFAPYFLPMLAKLKWGRRSAGEWAVPG